MAIAPRTKSVAYHSPTRSPKEREKSKTGMSPQHVTNTPDRVKKLLRVRSIDFVPQPAHQHIDEVGLGIEAVLPYAREDHRLRDDFASVPHEVFEQGKLSWSEIDSLTLPCDSSRQQIERQLVDRQRCRLGCSRCAADQGLHAGKELGERKRFGQVVVPARLEST